MGNKIINEGKNIHLPKIFLDNKMIRISSTRTRTITINLNFKVTPLSLVKSVISTTMKLYWNCSILKDENFNDKSELEF